MEAIIIAGGFGTRLQSVVSDVPKPMAPINGKPFLEYLVNNLIENGITRIIMAVGYKKEIIMQYFKDCYKDVEILYSIEDTPLLTGGAIKKALVLCKNENVLILNGDTFFDVNIKELMDFHNFRRSDFSLSLKKMYDFNRYGTVKIGDDGRVIEFCEKQYMEEGFINGGVYCIKRTVLDKIDETKFSFEKVYMEKYLTNDRMYGLESKGYFIDIGIPEDYEKAKGYFYK